MTSTLWYFISNTNTVHGHSSSSVIVSLNYIKSFNWKIFCMIWEHFKPQTSYSSQLFWVILCWAFVSIIADHVLTDLLWSNHKEIFTESRDNMKIRKILRKNVLLIIPGYLWEWGESSHPPGDIFYGWDWAGLVGYSIHINYPGSPAVRAGNETGNSTFNDSFYGNVWQHQPERRRVVMRAGTITDSWEWCDEGWVNYFHNCLRLMDCLDLIDTTETQTVTSRKHSSQGQAKLVCLAIIYQPLCYDRLRQISERWLQHNYGWNKPT